MDYTYIACKFFSSTGSSFLLHLFLLENESVSNITDVDNSCLYIQDDEINIYKCQFHLQSKQLSMYAMCTSPTNSVPNHHLDIFKNTCYTS